MPSIPADILHRIQKNSYVELYELLPEIIQVSFLYPEGQKKKVAPIDKSIKLARVAN